MRIQSGFGSETLRNTIDINLAYLPLNKEHELSRGVCGSCEKKWFNYINNIVGSESLNFFSKIRYLATVTWGVSEKTNPN
jgi:hypothetical protein